MPTCSIDGFPLHYLDEGAGLPVLLLHAFPLGAESFRPQLDALSGKYRLIAPDHRGFGRSGPTDGPLTMDQIARDALALLDHLGIERAVVGGVSMGGYATMALLREDAGRVLGLVLADTQAGADDEAGKQRREDTARAVLERGSELLVETMLPKLVAPGAAPEVRREVERLIRATPKETAASASRGMALRLDSRELLARFGGPALVVVGALDAITPPEKGRQLAELISGARYEQIEGAGHLSNLEAPEAFNAVADRFLSTIAG